MAREGKGLTLIDLFAVLFSVLIVVGALTYYLYPRGRNGHEAHSVRCAANLSQIGKGMAMYLNTLGKNSMYPLPADAFRGDAWLASLYWSGLIAEPRVFYCPSTDDDYTKIPPTQAVAGDLTSADAIPPDAISYAGRCKGTSLAHRNTTRFNESGLASASAMACDDNEGTQNHKGGINVVYFDAHVDFIPLVDYATIGAPGSEFQYLDSGE
jgi:prepilin-type processing-associated H-X9-DG protein